MAKKDAPERPRMPLLTIVAMGGAFLLLFDQRLRTLVGEGIGLVLYPVIGFGGRYPVLTILLAGTLMVFLSTVLRHFMTDWLDMAKAQSYMREFQKEMGKARKENNTYRMKKLQDQQPEVMKRQQQMSSKQLKTMPLTMLVVLPFFAWLLLFVLQIDYAFYSVPWNPTVDMFGTTVFPHWILLYASVSFPVGMLVQKTMKYVSWKERWKGRHPEVHE